jgi:type II secretory pathway component GspD/PulD (secretin)
MGSGPLGPERGRDLRGAAEQSDAGPRRTDPEQAHVQPFLNRIPILGLLFGSIEEKIEKTELVLLITPRVVGTALDAARITDQMRRITPELEDSIRRAPRPPSPPPAH